MILVKGSVSVELSSLSITASILDISFAPNVSRDMMVLKTSDSVGFLMRKAVSVVLNGQILMHSIEKKKCNGSYRINSAGLFYHHLFTDMTETVSLINRGNKNCK